MNEYEFQIEFNEKKKSNWLHQISHGIDSEPVLSRQAAKSIGCSKNFRGKLALDSAKKVKISLKTKKMCIFNNNNIN